MTTRQPEPSHAKPAAKPVDNLRAFEDHVLGQDHPRPHGEIEKGHGSAFAALPDPHKAHHAALEKLAAAEKKHQAAESAAQATHAGLEAAVKHANKTYKAVEAWHEKPQEPAPAHAFAGKPHEQALERAKARDS
jgi:hypothetical protein